MSIGDVQPTSPRSAMRLDLPGLSDDVRHRATTGLAEIVS